MVPRLQSGDTVCVRSTREIGVVLRVYRSRPEEVVVALGRAGLWTFPLARIERIDDLRSACVRTA